MQVEEYREDASKLRLDNATIVSKVRFTSPSCHSWQHPVMLFIFIFCYNYLLEKELVAILMLSVSQPAWFIDTTHQTLLRANRHLLIDTHYPYGNLCLFLLHCVHISTVARFSSTRFGTAQYCLCSHYAVSLAKPSGFHKRTIKYYLVYLLKLDAALALQASFAGILSFQLDRRPCS